MSATARQPFDRFRLGVERFLSLTFRMERGRHVDPAGVRGYPLDMSVRAPEPTVLPQFVEEPGRYMWSTHMSRGIGSFERWLAGDGEEWLAGARAAADVLVKRQEPGGGWLHTQPYTHTFSVPAPWISALAQGEGASLLVRLFLETREERYASAALSALKPLGVSAMEGGARASLDGRPFPEEYPTQPASFVLNGAMYALWGVRDVAVGLGDSQAGEDFAAGVETLAANIHRWDTGRWSLYDLFPHRITHLASPAYHNLHVMQLDATDELMPNADLRAAAARFAGYAESPRLVTRAIVGKAVFRAASPRNQRMAAVLPWARGQTR